MSEKDSEYLEADILYAGATRPAMIFGVTYTFAVANCMAAIMLFMAVANPFYLVTVIPGHVIGYFVCLKDPRTFEIIMVWLQTMAKCRNRHFWGKSTYVPLS